MRTRADRTQQPTSIAIEGKILRRDGTEEELGTIAYAHKNPILHLLGQRAVRGGGILRTLVRRGPKIQ